MADPTQTSEDEFDFDNMRSWILVQQLMDFFLFLVLFLPGWLALRSSWRHLLRLSLPAFHPHGIRFLSAYAGLELGYRCSRFVDDLREKRFVDLGTLRDLVLFAVLVWMPTVVASAQGRLLLSVFMLKHQVSLFQSVYTIFRLDRLLNRRYFSLVLNISEVVLLVGGSFANRALLNAPLVLVLAACVQPKLEAIRKFFF